MWYVIFCGMMAGWVYIDSGARMQRKPVTIVLSFLFAPLYGPYYLATRNLKKGEVRKRGGAWNYMIYFLAVWSLLCSAAVIGELIMPFFTEWGVSSKPEGWLDLRVLTREFSIIFTIVELGTFLVIWIAVCFIAILVGWIFSKPSSKEEGPTGPLSPARAIDSSSDP